MTTFFIINAIARYYNISFVEAKIMYNSRQTDDQYDQCVEWYQDQLDDRMLVCMQSNQMLNAVFKDWMYDHYPDGVRSDEELAMAIHQFGDFVERELRDLYDIDIEERGDEV